MFRNVVITLFAVLLLQGSVWGAPGDGIGGVNVGIRKKPGRGYLSSAQTDASGNFTFADLAAGSYTLIFTIAKAQQVVDPTGKSFYESRSNTANRVGVAFVFEWTSWPYTISVSTSGVTSRMGTISMSGSNVIVTIDFDVAPVGGNNVTITGTARKAGKLPADKARDAAEQ